MKQVKIFLCLLMTTFCMVGTTDAKVKKYKNGDFYSGEWKKGKPEGMGKMFFVDGTVYDGLWQNGNIVGEGIITKGNIKFKGKFIPIYENGIFKTFTPIKGIYTESDEEMDGEWDTNSVFEGKVHNVKLPNSSFIDLPAIYNGKYEGYIKNNKFNGEGILTTENTTYSGSWTDGILTDGYVKQLDPKGNTYEIIVKNGTATYSFPDGEILTIKGKLDGNNQLYLQINEHKELRDKIKKQVALAKEQEALAKEQEVKAKAAKEAKDKAAKELSSKYGGMIFQGEGSILALRGGDEGTFLGLLFGTHMTQNLYVVFQKDGKVYIKEMDSDVISSDPNRISDAQMFALLMNSSGGTTYEAIIKDDKIFLSNDLYIVVSKDKRMLTIYGKNVTYRLKRK